MKPIHRSSRRHFLRIVASSVSLGLLAACRTDASTANPTMEPAPVTTRAPLPSPTAGVGAPTTVPASSPAVSAASGMYNEAPMLAELVRAGQLPPVDQRLPNAPMIVDVVDEIGQYGGTWTITARDLSGSAVMIRSILYDGLVRWNMDWTDVLPNLAERWEINADSTQYTFTLRNGVRWSDGEPFTAGDILFWIEDVESNKELSSGLPNWMRVNGKPLKATSPDPYTIIFSFDEPNSLFLQLLATPDALEMTNIQAKYAKQWHATYNPQAAEIAKQNDLPSWVELFDSKTKLWGARRENPDLPTLAAWRLTSDVDEDSRMVAERNPYYWKVDRAGNQLPYLDNVVYEVMDNQTSLVKTLNGKVDILDRVIVVINNKDLLTANQEQGNYSFTERTTFDMNTTTITFNLAHKNTVKREIFNNIRFRQALSHAIDRQAIIAMVFAGEGEPAQLAPRRDDTDFFDEEMLKQFTTYDVKTAKQLLDEAGFVLSPDNQRLGPDNQPIVFELQAEEGTTRVAVANLIAWYWKAVGIEAQVIVTDRDTIRDRRNDNDHDVIVYPGMENSMLNPRWYLPYDSESAFGVAWFYWFDNPSHEQAVEPPEEIKQQITLYNQLKATSDPIAQKQVFKQIIANAKAGFYSIGIATRNNSYRVVSNSFRNMPSKIPSAWVYPDPAPTQPEQYFKINT